MEPSPDYSCLQEQSLVGHVGPEEVVVSGVRFGVRECGLTELRDSSSTEALVSQGEESRLSRPSSNSSDSADSKSEDSDLVMGGNSALQNLLPKAKTRCKASNRTLIITDLNEENSFGRFDLVEPRDTRLQVFSFRIGEFNQIRIRSGPRVQKICKKQTKTKNRCSSPQRFFQFFKQTDELSDLQVSDHDFSFCRNAEAEQLDMSVCFPRVGEY